MENKRLTQLQSFLEGNPDDSFLIFAIAKEYEKLEHLNEALNGYIKLREKDPEYVGLYYHLGKLYETLKKDVLAVATYKEGIEIAKSQGDFHALSELNNAKMNLEIQLGN